MKKLERIIKICEFCGTSFEVKSTSTRRFCSRKCMYEWRKKESHTKSKCEHCGKEYVHYKSQPRKFCSEDCMRRSDYKKELTRTQFLKNNPMKNLISIEKIKKTKKKRYGNSNYNNMEKYYSTMMDRYGVHTSFKLPNSKSAGKSISKINRKYHKKIKKTHSDAILEHFLKDAKISVDIFIPSKNQVIEIYGDYWHCNPELFENNYYHKQLHMTAEEKWEYDEERINKIKGFGYDVKIIWEKDLDL